MCIIVEGKFLIFHVQFDVHYFRGEIFNILRKFDVNYFRGGIFNILQTA